MNANKAQSQLRRRYPHLSWVANIGYLQQNLYAWDFGQVYTL